MSTQYDLHEIVKGSDKQTNFTTQLLKLILKADVHNMELIRKGFPNAVTTIEIYRKKGVIPDLETD